ncbi:thioredoxin family protein [Mesonia sp. MT50]|uniref:Thioredoxin family protein n=1 Tax=Mesonia profundi TaxID=3070998 RepID=A0ABU0ZYS4_9FLAO|nr:thioredoxin family protein [Mesonia profundi]MDQ7916606.1 thioredoxin family protein [Mesonia profundi]
MLKFLNSYSITFCLIMLVQTAFSQQEKAVNWLSFEQLEDSLAVHPKKVFIDFYANWCEPCLKMQKEVFPDKKVIKMLQENFYAVKMNVETEDTIVFGGQSFVNERGNRRNPIHQIPLLMARQKNIAFSLPAVVFLDENFKATARHFQYLNVKQLLSILEKQKNL